MTSTGSTPVAGGPEFQTRDLETFIVRLTALMLRAAHDLLRLPDLDPRYRAALGAVVGNDGALRERAAQILRALEDEDFEAPLAEHGLAPESPELELKLAAFDAALQRSQYRPRASDPNNSQHQTIEFEDVVFVLEPEEPREGRLRKVLTGLAAAFKVGNSVAKSLSKSVPGAGAYAEIKESIEEGVDTAANAGGIVKRIARRIPGLRRRSGH